MSSGGTVTSCVTSRHCTCTGHITVCYKRSANTSFEALLAHLALWALSSWPFIRPSGSPWPPAYGRCLTRVGHDTSSASLGWSLLPSSIIIVLALVNSAVSPQGDQGISTRPSSVLPQDCCAFQLVPVCIMVEVSPKLSMLLPPCPFRIWCMTILGIPG